MEKEKDIEKTASTLVDILTGVDTKYGREVLTKLKKIKEITSFAPQLAGLVASRYLTSNAIIEEYLARGFHPNIIELGAGFSPHSLDLGKKVVYIEVDLPTNSEIKQKIAKEINPSDSTIYIAGDIFLSNTWERIKKHINPKQPTIIFGEGFFIYTTKEQRVMLAKEILPLTGNEGCLFFEDSLRYHPEWDLTNNTQKGIKGILQTSKSKAYSEKISQEELTKEWESYGFKVERRTPIYVKANSDIAKKLKTWVLKQR